MPSRLPYELRKRMPQCAPKTPGGYVGLLLRGEPPEQSRRCQFARGKPDSRGGAGRVGQCRKYARHGSRYCHAHACADRGVRFGVARWYKNPEVPEVYKVIGRSLGERLRDLEAQEAQALQLREELRIYRASCDEALEMYDMAREARMLADEALAADPANARLQEACRRALEVCEACGGNVRAVMSQVADMAESAARIEASSKGQFSPGAVRSIMSQVAMLMYELCGEEHQDLAQQFELQMGVRIRIADQGGPALGSSGTESTPDQLRVQVAAMDASVPRCST